MRTKQTLSPIYLSLALLVALSPRAAATDGPSVHSPDRAPEVPEQHGVGHKVLYYIPNRVPDLVDMDFIEVADFLIGLIMLDLRKDDL
jgi:hypothetical protein